MSDILETVPSELISYVLSFLEAPELVLFGATSHFNRELTSQSALWRGLCQSRWPDQFEEEIRIQDDFGVADPLFWKKHYIQKHLLGLMNTLSWTQISLTQSSLGGVKPTARYAHSGTVYDNKIVYIGGQMAQKHRYNDFFFYDTTTGHFTQPKIKGNPPNISKHTTLEIDGIFYTFGGYDGISQRFELSCFDPVKRQWWTPDTTGDIPLSRSNHASTVHNKKMYIFGGLLQQELELVDSNDMHVLDTTTMVWSSPKVTGDVPEPRCGHKMVTIDDKIYLFGGGNGDNWLNKFNDLHLFDPATNHWTKLTTTGEDVDATTFASVWNVGRFLFVFGGGRIKNRGSVSNEIFAYDTVTRHWTKQILAGNQPTERDDCTTNVVGDVVYLMHGYNSGAIDEFWSIKMSPAFYRNVHGVEPPSRVIKESHSPVMTLSPTLKKMKQKICQLTLSPFGRRNSSSKS